MIDGAKTTLVLGPPGCGKTTTLLGYVEAELGAGVDPAKIGYVSFSTRAAHEARDRAAKRFGLEGDDLPWFRTIHSLAFRQLALAPSAVVRPANLKELGSLLNVDITGARGWEDGTMFAQSKGDRALHMDQLARVWGIPLSDQWQRENDRLSYFYVERISRGLQEYKSSRGLIDFTDMLVEFVRRGTAPNIEVLCIDEAQDLSSLQWLVVERLAARARKVIVAGDDDQAIYAWAGSDLDYFLRIPGKEQVLEQSYRVPIAVQQVAKRIVERITVRREKKWKPRAEDGDVSYLSHPDELDLSTGQWLVLARNKYLLAQVAEVCHRHGYFFTHNGAASVSAAHLAAITAWEKLRSGQTVSVEEVHRFLPYVKNQSFVPGAKKTLRGMSPMAALHGSTLKEAFGLSSAAIWHVALDKIPSGVRDYVIASLRRGEKLRSEPRIRLSTVHAAKGSEADNVALLTDMSGRTAKDAVRVPEAEARVWYVATTRARNRLVVVRPQTHKHYAL